jgi:hypothetical protein
MTYVNLQERFGHRYRVGWEANGATKGQWPREDWPWLMEIPCRYGLIYPKGGEILQAMTGRPNIRAELRALPVILSSRGDLETVVTFRVDDAEQVFALLKPYRRRQVSDAERDRLRALSARHGFPRKDRQDIGASERDGLESTIGSENDSSYGRPEAGTKAS